MGEPDHNFPKRQGVLYRRLDHDPAKTNVALKYCDECGKLLEKGERNRNRILRDSTPLDFAGRGRSQRERLLVERPKTLAAKCMLCWDRWKHDKDERRALHTIRRHTAATMSEAARRGKGEGVSIGAWVKAGGHEVIAKEGTMERTFIIRS